MPVVTIQVTREGTTPGVSSTTPEQKAALIKGTSELLRDVLGKPMESTFVIIEEVDTDNWGWGGLPALDYRKKLAAATALKSSR
ncbi:MULTISPECIES: 4-oxalocrotonate tautomerase family protein [unclassified Bradyrhizobium]|uniref:tautomerase family protein n=1 Tax=unclassified Bradyrhizobium TaxID=2631580 RepID=UPI001BA8F858|nr:MULTISPECIES: 4-oxalocrotonate tautomerase family protein [unclassified Bradyrhizobium]MBR1204129.1 4-oxalocrotonate tautomerase family protein [Bradyrhizobium sp. AUGA SZCCT0124]MBR1309985.1 4-oxalocrotonate tautomerase family protein [Bradyrhizobium sp. AUGA SZCCT0051]MBR1340126.1 4-oxalocrotonate tautomerase family protein [Bradyrhizobium sp. AUGA SZCCT0105]MBR1354733.1 4-oxalocrotonate tautomerase family protein [Bradyrhizobium sp. AUGA SZCCT0045]